MGHVVHQSRAVHGLALILALLFALQPAGLSAPTVEAAGAVALQAQALAPLVQGFWETVLMYAGR
jgi:hypothetical protein